jgi:hypothetical protein
MAGSRLRLPVQEQTPAGATQRQLIVNRAVGVPINMVGSRANVMADAAPQRATSPAWSLAWPSARDGRI